MSARIYNIHWHGPFTKEQVEDIQKTSRIYELYLLKGKKPHAKRYHYYCGESHGRSADIRLFDDNHHIKDYRDVGIDEKTLTMNRILLIGNGFDLAHSLKTSYADFIDWYWENEENVYF